MIKSLVSPTNRIRTLIFLAVCILLSVAAAVVGIDDNPPGLLLGFLATVAFFLIFVHPWRKAKQFLRLFFASIAGLILFGALTACIDILTANLGDTGLLPSILHAFGAVILFLAMLCPAGLLVGAIGALVMAIRNRCLPRPGSTPSD